MGIVVVDFLAVGFEASLADRFYGTHLGPVVQNFVSLKLTKF